MLLRIGCDIKTPVRPLQGQAGHRQLGREGQITLRCRNSLVGVVLDRFGRDAILVPDGEEHSTVTVPAVVSPQFLGWVFGLGDGVQILRPDWAAEELKRQLAAVAALYQ